MLPASTYFFSYTRVTDLTTWFCACLSVSLSLSLSLCLPDSVSLSLSVSLCLSVSVSLIHSLRRIGEWSTEDITSLRSEIDTFLRSYVKAFGEKSFSINFHKLLHLPDHIDQFGSLHVFSVRNLVVCYSTNVTLVHFVVHLLPKKNYPSR